MDFWFQSGLASSFSPHLGLHHPESRLPSSINYKNVHGAVVVGRDEVDEVVVVVVAAGVVVGRSGHCTS